MNHDIEYHIDKHSELGYSSEEDTQDRGSSDQVMNKTLNKLNNSDKSKLRDKSQIFTKEKDKNSINRQKANKKEKYPLAVSSSSSSEPVFQGNLVSYPYPFPMFDDQSQYHHNQFNTDMLENLTGFNTSHPLIMRWLLECPDETKCPEMDTVNAKSPVKQKNDMMSVIQRINVDPQADKYLRQIIKTYNALQIQYTNLFNSLRDSLIRAGDDEFTDPQYIMEPITINYKSMPHITVSFYDFMKDLKADINRITKTIEQLYLIVGDKSNKAHTKRIKNFYRKVRAKKVPLVPNTLFRRSEMNKNLGDIFNLLGGVRSDASSSTSGEIKGGGNNLNDADALISSLRSKLNMYKEAIKPWDISKIHKISDKHRAMLMPDQQNVYETDVGSRSKKIYLDTFDKLDKDHLLDSILEKDDPLDRGLTFTPVLETHDLDGLIKGIDLMYKDSAEKLQSDNIERSIVWMREFINYQYQDLAQSAFTFTGDVWIDQKKRNLMKDALDVENRKLIIRTKYTIDVLNFYLQVTDISMVMAMMFKFLVDAKKITAQKNPYIGAAPGQIYSVIRRMTDLSQDIANIQTGFDKMSELLPYFTKEGYDSLKKTSPIRKIFQSRYGREDTYFFDKQIPESRPPRYTLSAIRAKVGKILSDNLNTEAISYHTGDLDSSELLDKEVLLSKVDALIKLDEQLNTTSEKEMGLGLFPGGSSITKDEYQTYFKQYIESTEKLLTVPRGVDSEIEQILDRQVLIPPSFMTEYQESKDVRSYLKNMSSDQNLMQVMNQHIADYSSIDLMVGHINTYYQQQISEYTETLETLERQVKKSSDSDKENINEQLVIDTVDTMALKLEIRKLVDLLDDVDQYDEKLQSYGPGVVRSYQSIARYAKSSYYVGFEPKSKPKSKQIKLPEIDESLMGGVRVEGTGNIEAKIDENNRDVSIVINNLFNKITQIENIKRGMGDVGSVLKNAFDLVDMIQGIVLFTLNILQSSISSCLDQEAVCNMKMIKYIDYSHLKHMSKTIKTILSSPELMGRPQIRLVKGPIVRTDNFLNRLFKVVEEGGVKVPTYVMIDVKKKSFIPLLVTQGLMFYDFGL